MDDRRWLSAREFEDAIAACNLLPGPASTQLAILSAWRVAGPAGAIIGGAAFIIPGIVIIVALAALFLAASPPTWVLGAGAGAGAAVAAVAVHAGADLIRRSWTRAPRRWRWLLYALIGATSAATVPRSRLLLRPVRHLEGTPDVLCRQRRAGSTDEFDPRGASDPMTDPR